MYTVVDLFAGAGGLSLGFQQAERYNIKVAFENNASMQETYKRNHPGVEVKGDVCSADYDEIVRKYGKIDVVIGGPPCQGFSNANRQRTQAISKNNSLVKEYIRAILELKPKAFVMENVSMLKSKVHRFYLSYADVELVDAGSIQTKNSEIFLLGKDYIFDEMMDIVKDQCRIKSNIWEMCDYKELNVIYKASHNPTKLIKALEKHRKQLLKMAEKNSKNDTDDTIQTANNEAFDTLKRYYNGEIEATKLKDKIEPAIMYQRMLQRAMEIYENELVVDSYATSNGFVAKVKSFAVFDYIKAKLATGEGENGYVMNEDVLSAVEFGAPQKRMRFVIMGIRKDIASDVQLPTGQLKNGPYRTVRDAIGDLEDKEPVYDPSDDKGIRLDAPMMSIEETNGLEGLRDTECVCNHIITKTTDVAMERFRALKPGQNFHALDDKMKTNTYTDVKRTQNTVYLRLKYDEPSGTVINVRKSMWIHPTKDRAISVREAARLQTFPDSFVFCGSKDKQYQQVGNAVPPILARAIAETLALQLDEAGVDIKEELERLA